MNRVLTRKAPENHEKERVYANLHVANSQLHDNERNDNDFRAGQQEAQKQLSIHMRSPCGYFNSEALLLREIHASVTCITELRRKMD
jgi:hypothetical protein